MSNPTHHEPTDLADMSDEEFARWSDEQDNRYAANHAERERDAYLDYHEAHDVQVMDELDGTSEPDGWTVSHTLRSAAQYLAAHGWIQGDFYDTSDTVFTPAACLVGAFGMVCYGGPVDAPALNYNDPGWDTFDDARNALDDYLADRYGQIEPGFRVDAYTFNDARGRTVDEVITALNQAADRWDTTRGGAA